MGRTAQSTRAAPASIARRMAGTHDRLMSRSAVALFIGAGAVTIANSYASRRLGTEGVNIAALRLCGVLSLASGLFISWLAPKTLGLRARLAVAVWGLVLHGAAAALGKSAV